MAAGVMRVGGAAPEPEPRRCMFCMREWPSEDGEVILWAEQHCRETRNWLYCPANMEDAS
jgi:hypothetical protein